MDASKDHFERRCPRLGGSVSFGYCRTCGENNTACWKIFDCWWERFDVVSHLSSCLTEEQFEALLACRRPKPKLSSLVELIEQAKNRQPGG